MTQDELAERALAMTDLAIDTLDRVAGDESASPERRLRCVEALFALALDRDDVWPE